MGLVAHYTQTLMRRLFLFLTLLSMAAPSLPAAAPAKPAKPAQPASRQRTEAELQVIAAQIEQVRQQVQRDAVARDRLARELRAAEQTVASARSQLAQLRAQRDQRATARERLRDQRRERQTRLAADRAQLAKQLRALYLLGRQDPLLLLLNQHDPGEAARRLTYGGYIGRFRASQIDRINADIASIDDLDRKIAAEDQRLSELEGRQRVQVGELEKARVQRGKVLVSLEQEAQNRVQSLARLQRQQAALEAVLKEINRALERFSAGPNDAFAKLRGKLGWPVEGRLAARFGEIRAGSVRWNGVLVVAERGTPVRAIHAGRVAYADWLPGLGQLLIIDHGGGYLSLYGHNDQLYKSTGATVAPGEVVAAVGDTGGRDQPELYFEIRSGGKPIDPRPWFSRPTPP